MKIRQKVIEPASMAFLSVITCCFGAIILLLVITTSRNSENEEDPGDPRIPEISLKQRQIFSMKAATLGQAEELDKSLRMLEKLNLEKDAVTQKVQRLASQNRFIDEHNKERKTSIQKLLVAQQNLTDEMKRLYRELDQKETNLVGGIPIDSEYIIFIIDTSGSMFRYAWPKVIAQIEDTLRVYPKVKGVQIMNDMGVYMFPSFRGKWIPDSPARRRAINDRLKTWNAFSNSSPAEGITEAIQTFNAEDKKISIYVYGDEFTGDSIRHVVDYVDKINHSDTPGGNLVRIHAIGFPVQFAQPAQLQHTGIRFATLMRELTRKNGGTFVGLNSFR
jgi:hypothetical protein